MKIRLFNRICAAVALAVLALWCFGGLLEEPGFEDFGQYYIGGLVAREGAWASLYPVPIPGATKNAGWRDGSTMKPAYADLAASAGVGDVNRFVLPPPMAIAFAPLTLLPAREAAWIWAALMILCGWGVGLLAGHFHELASGRPSKISGVLCLLVTISPLMRRTIGTSQISPLVALCGAAAIAALHRRRNFAAAAAILGGTLAKLAPIALVPLAAVLGRLRALAWAAALGAGVLLLTLPLTGVDPYLEFLRDIAPTLRHSSAWRGNQSIPGFLLRVTRQPALPPSAAAALSAGRLLLFAAVVALIVRARRAIANSAMPLMAASAALLLALLIPAPIFWEHYFVYLCPLWGWLLCEARQSAWRAVAAASVIGATWAPWAILPWLKLREPFTSHMLAAALMMMALSLTRLWRAGGEGAPAPAAAGPPAEPSRESGPQGPPPPAGARTPGTVHLPSRSAAG